MNTIILVMLISTIVYLLYKEKSGINRTIKSFLRLNEKKIVCLTGTIYISISFIIYISNLSSDFSTTIPLLSLFLIGCIYIIYARSRQFDFISVIRKIYNQNLDQNNKSIPHEYSSITHHIKSKYNSNITTQPLFKATQPQFILISPEYIQEYCISWAKENITKDSTQDFIKLIYEKKINRKIELIGKNNRNSEYTYWRLFELLNAITLNGIRHLYSSSRKQFIFFICNNFAKEGKDINYGRLDASFSYWRKVNNI